MSGRNPDFLIPEDPDGSAQTGGHSHLDVSIGISDDPGRSEINAEPFRCRKNHSRIRFGRIIPVSSHAGVGINRVKGSPFGLQQGGHALVDFLEVPGGHESFAYALLTGHDNGKGILIVNDP